MNLDNIYTPHLAIYAGGTVIAGSTAYVIAKSGAIISPHSVLLLCLAFGIFAAAFVLGEGKTASKTTFALIAALIAAESFNLLNNSERLVMARESEQTPMRGKVEAFAAAKRAVAEAKASKATSERLARADRALAEARAANLTQRFDAAQRAVEAAEEAVTAERQTGCKKHCRDQQAIADRMRIARQAAADADAKAKAALIAKAEAEVRSAAIEAEALKAKRIATAEADLKATPMPPSATALADRLGIDSASLDIIAAVAMSIAVIGLGATLVAHGSGDLAIERANALQASLHSVSASEAATVSKMVTGDLPDPPQPPKGGNRRRKAKTETVSGGKRFPANVVAFPAHPVLNALRAVGGSVSSNQELADLMSVSEGEASKRCREVADHLEIERIGKRTSITLRA